MLEHKPVNFPHDELPHETIIEWWYFNGHLNDSAGKHYAFMDCLFRANPKKVKIPFLKNIPFKEIYFSHSLLSDISANKFYSEINPLVFISQDSFSHDLFFVNYTRPSLKGYFNYEIKKPSLNSWYLKTPVFQLDLKNKKPALLVGGSGFVDLHEDSTYYYSLTNLQTSGEIVINGRRTAVVGKSWMDHQWANAAYSNFKWSWFSIQLENNTEIVCFSFEHKSNSFKLASVIYSDGSQKNYKNVELVELGEKWQSPNTGTVYPLAWRIKIPEAKIDLQVKPLVKEQEMIFGLINYWEGGLAVSGKQGGNNVSGAGFLELVGYPSKKSKLNYYRKLLQANLRRDLKKAFSK